MEIEEQKGLNFNGVDFVKINFEAHGKYEGKKTIDITLKPRVFYPEGKTNNSHFIIMMDVLLVCPKKFNLSLLALGNFIVGDDLIGEKRKSIINTNAPAIMFPYVRSFISTFTSSLGDTTKGGIIIPPQFFSGNIEVHVPDDDEESQS